MSHIFVNSASHASPNRPLEIAAFLDQNKWGTATIEIFDGDFSPRRYARLTHDDGTSAILMDADVNQNTLQFVALAKILRACNVHTPDIYAAAPQLGLVLMEDMGNLNLGAALDRGSKAETLLLQAVEPLVALHSAFRPESLNVSDYPIFTTDFFVMQAELFLDAYLPSVKGRDATEDERNDFRSAWSTVLRPATSLPTTLILRDYMPDNLMLCSDGSLGVLDFQDGGIGPIAYDLASLCEEVRRDGMFDFLPALIASYRTLSGTAVSESDLMRACIVLSAQRHTRILGIITRIATLRGDKSKLDYIPRVQRHLRRIMPDPALMPVRVWMEEMAIL